MARKEEKDVRSLLSDLGFMFEMFKVLIHAVLKLGGTREDLKRLVKEPSLVDEIAKLIVVAKSDVIRFIARDSFNFHNTRVKFGRFNDNFKSWFLNKVEELAKVELPKHHHDLERNSLDAEILTDLGGEATAEVTLAGVYKLLELQPKGESGPLLTNSYANIFYVKDVGGVLRAVYVPWRGGGWRVYAFSVEAPDGWVAGDRVFSRSS